MTVLVDGCELASITVLRDGALFGAETRVGERLFCIACEYATLGALLMVVSAQIAGAVKPEETT